MLKDANGILVKVSLRLFGKQPLLASVSEMMNLIQTATRSDKKSVLVTLANTFFLMTDLKSAAMDVFFWVDTSHKTQAEEAEAPPITAEVDAAERQLRVQWQ